ncbi:MAG: exodeoxyribonuclease V subunit alpha [Proteobacteria bacterium]|nr:exodeoxyribonuclease V subunit alpha [Pseudomonadota bacterium]MBU1688323.1 exodeoxyribonuclease V subunit alpha [Pseudomonadota bacterium]
MKGEPVEVWLSFFPVILEEEDGVSQSVQNEDFSELDISFADFLSRLAGGGDRIRLGAALVSKALGQGHGCVDLENVLAERIPGSNSGEVSLVRWREELSDSSVVGGAGTLCPLILDENRLYLHRYWQYEDEVRRFLLNRMSQPLLVFDRVQMYRQIRNIFEVDDGSADPDQVTAALAILCRHFVVISGGPGTGKTSTILRILALLIVQGIVAGADIGLAAPTGKAARRLQETMVSQLQGLNCANTVKEQMVFKVQTLHRLLGPIRDSVFFRHNETKPLPFKVVVVDEASMVDVSLMAKLLRALPPDCRLILLGDHAQLSSVEPGSVLGDICFPEAINRFSTALYAQIGDLVGTGHGRIEIKTEQPCRSDSLVNLRKSYRFGDQSGIGQLAEAVKEGQGEQVMALLHEGALPDISWREVVDRRTLRTALADSLPRITSFLEYLDDFQKVFAALVKSRVLCALRQGPFGAPAVNGIIEDLLRDRGMIETGQRYYNGRPLLILKNDYDLELYNGDTGIVLSDLVGGKVKRCVFPGAQGGEQQISPTRLPLHESVYAMTVHKSQGSEFQDVIVLLPPGGGAVVSRELLYTALTRAREHVEIWAAPEDILRAVATTTHRQSGLRQKVWSGEDIGQTP